MKDKVSIALATYNGELYLKALLDSLLQQDYIDFEIIVCDDCSTDQTYSILLEYQKQNANFFVFRNNKNLGFNKNFEKALSLCRGEFIAIADQDDIWSPQKISTLKNNIGDFALIYHDSEYIDEQGKSLNKFLSSNYNLVTSHHYFSFILGFNIVSGHTMMFRRVFIEKYTPLPILENTTFLYDATIALCATFEQKGLVYIDDVLVKYRQHSKSTIRNINVIKQGFNLSYYICNVILQILTQDRQEDRLFLTKLMKTFCSGKKYNFSYDRMRLIFSQRAKILAYKRKSTFRKILYCLKMLFVCPK